MHFPPFRHGDDEHPGPFCGFNNRVSVIIVCLPLKIINVFRIFVKFLSNCWKISIAIFQSFHGTSLAICIFITTSSILPWRRHNTSRQLVVDSSQAWYLCFHSSADKGGESLGLHESYMTDNAISEDRRRNNQTDRRPEATRCSSQSTQNLSDI